MDCYVLTKLQLNLPWLCLLLVGCGGNDKFTVTGHVVLMDGSPLVGSRLVFRSDNQTTCTATTDLNGFYQVGTSAPGDGAPAGSYSIAIVENRGDYDHPNPQKIHAKYAIGRKSGLKFKVPDDGATYDLVLDPP